MKKTHIFITLVVLAALSGSASFAAQTGVSALTRGNTLALKGDYAEALKSFNEAIKLNPKWGQAYCHRAATLVKLGQYKEALDDCDKSIKYDPHNVHTFVLRGLIYKQLGNRKKEINDMRSARKLIQSVKGKDKANSHVGFDSESNSHPGARTRITPPN